MLTATITALRDLTIVGKSRVSESDKILLRVGWPAFFEAGTLWLRVEIESHHVLAVQLSLKVDKTKSIANFFLL